MRLAVLFVLLAITYPVTKAFANDVASASVMASGITEISLKRHSCLGMCPADEVILFADGTALYAGYTGAPRAGLYTGKIDVNDYHMYATYLVQQGFFEKDVGIIGPRGPDEGPIRYISAVRDGVRTSKRLVSDVAPSWWAMEILFRSVSDKVNWHPVESGIRGRLLTSFEDKNNFWTNLPLPNALISISRVANIPATTRLSSLSQFAFLCRTNKDGRFELPLPAGQYIITSRYYPLQGPGVVGREMIVTVQSLGFSEVILAINKQ